MLRGLDGGGCVALMALCSKDSLRSLSEKSAFSTTPPSRAMAHSVYKPANYPIGYWG